MAGYDFQVIDQYPQQLHCVICTLIIHNAMNGCRKHVFCKACIEKYVENEMKSNGNMKCPRGCAIAINSNELEPNEFVDRLVNTLSCKCSNDACDWKGDLLDLIQDHQRNCDYNLQSCDNEGCDVKYYKIDVVQHDEVCQYKLILCAYCQTNRRRIDKEQHVVECLDEQVNCNYYDIGCMKKVCRRVMASHEEMNQSEHTKLIYQNLVTCKKELVASQNEIAILKQENAAMKEDNATIKEENAIIKEENAAIKQDNVTIKEDNFVMKDESASMKEESKLLKERFAELEISLKTTSKGGQELSSRALFQ